MATGGFNLGGFGATAATGTGGGFSFGGQRTTAPTLGLGTVNPGAANTAAAAGGLGGFSLTSKTTAPTGLGGFNLAAPTQATAGLAAKTTTGTAAGGFSFGLTAPAASTAAAPGAGFSLGGGLGAAAPAATTTSAAAPAATGFSFGLTPGATATTAAATTAGATGLNFGGTTAATGGGLGGGLGGFNFACPISSAPSLGLGGLGTATASTAGSIFNKTPAAPTFTGLGGVDPKTSSTGGVGGSGTSTEGKAVKETFIPDQLVVTVDELQKYVKGEKAVREDIVRMSAKPLVKVQEDTAALKQLLSVVSNGLQRNACTLDKLKAQMTQELKNAEMAQRTKDIPPGLQYENTAPLEYFSQLVDQFESSMVSYRQQIEMLESHLGALQQPARHSPDEVFTLMKSQHQSFIALAAQLQEVHEAIKVQKEQFATHRRIFHGETKNVFPQSSASLAVSRPVQRRPADMAGPTPFPGITNPAAAVMASLINRPQQHHGPPIAGLLGSTHTAGASWLGGAGAATGFGSTGLLGGTSLLGQTGGGGGGDAGTSGFPSLPGGISSSAGSLASTLGSLNNTANASLNMSAATKQPFSLQKPPLGAKRGKR